MVKQLRADVGLENDSQAETALGIVLDSLVRRLTPDEAEDLIAQLPSLLQPALYALPLGPDKIITQETIEQQLAQQLSVEPLRAEKILAAVGALIAQTVSTGQMEDVRSQLPKSLREVFLEAPVAAAS
jgi:uncharacterized protein (DUF2267 family)